MKFTKEQAAERISAELGKTKTLSDRSINETLDLLMPKAGEEVELDGFVSEWINLFKTNDGQQRKERADFIKGQPAPKTEPKPQDEDFSTQIEKILGEKLASIQSKLDAFETNRSVESIFETAKSEFSKKHQIDESDERKLKARLKVFDMVKPSVSKDSKQEDIVSKMKAEFDSIADLAGWTDVYVPIGSSDTPPNTENAEYYAKLRDDLKKEGVI